MTATLSLLAIALFAAAAASDLRSRRIPNRLSVALAGLGLVRLALGLAAGAGAAALAVDLAAAVAVFALAALTFHFGVIGGGDVKLLAAGTLWLGTASLAPYLMLTVLSGGGLAVLFLRASSLRAGAPGRGRAPRCPTASLSPPAASPRRSLASEASGGARGSGPRRAPGRGSAPRPGGRPVLDPELEGLRQRQPLPDLQPRTPGVRSSTMQPITLCPPGSTILPRRSTRGRGACRRSVELALIEETPLIRVVSLPAD